MTDPTSARSRRLAPGQADEDSTIEHALRRELHEAAPHPEASRIYIYNEYGFPVLKREGDRKAVITNDMISKIAEETEDSQ